MKSGYVVFKTHTRPEQHSKQVLKMAGTTAKYTSNPRKI